MTTPTLIRNGVDTEQVYGTLDALKAQPELARFVFRATNRWMDGTHSRTTIQDFWGAGQEDSSRDEPFVLDALAGCLTLTIVNVAAARKVTLTEVSSTLEGVLDARGATGLDDAYRNGFERINVGFTLKGEAPAEKLQEIVERAKARSVVFDII